MLNLDNSIALIGDLISFPTVSSDSNRELLAYVESYLARHGVRSEIIWNEDGSKGNLWATIGPSDRPGVILSGHSDVVPVAGQAWTRDPFRMWQEDHRLCGRGACDMKGFVGIEGFAKETLLPRMQAVAPEASITIDEMVAYAGLDLAVDHSAVTFMKHLLGRALLIRTTRRTRQRAGRTARLAPVAPTPRGTPREASAVVDLRHGDHPRAR